MKKLFASLVLAIILIGIVAPFAQVEARREYRAYIVVELKSIYIFDDKDPADTGELEVVTVVTTGNGKSQFFTWPRKEQDYSWQSIDDGYRAIINAPIFSLREDEIGQGLIIGIATVDNDELPGWVGKLVDGVIKLADYLAKSAGWIFQLAVKGVDYVHEAVLQYISEGDEIGTYAAVWTPTDWGDGYFSVSSRAGDMRVLYEIRRVNVPARTPGASVMLKRISGPEYFANALGRDGDSSKPDPKVFTRVFTDFGLPIINNTFTAPSDEIGTHGTYEINQEIFRWGSMGPFLYVEASVWDDDLGSDNDQIAVYSQTFYPWDNWGIGTTVIERRGGPPVEAQGMDIELEIAALPFYDVEVVLSPNALDIKPGDTGTCQVTVTNIGNTGDTYSLSLEGLESTWYSFSTQSVTLDPGVSSNLDLNLAPPKAPDTTPGDHNFKVTATSTADPSATNSDPGVLNVLPFGNAEVFLMRPSVFAAEPSDKVTYTFGITNLGNIKDNYGVSVVGLDNIQESWITLWPCVFLNLDPGETGIGYLEIIIPEDWGRLGLETAMGEFTIRAASEFSSGATYEATGQLGIKIGERELCLDLSGQADYLWMEQVKIKLGALVKDIHTDLPLSGATVNVKIYRPPDGQLWIDTAMIESAPGLYQWQSEKTIQEYIRANNWQLVKGTFIAYVEAQYEDGPKTTKTVSFHLDPPAEAELPSIAYYLTTIIISIAATLALSRLLYNRGFRKPKHH